MANLPDILLERLEGAHLYGHYIAALCPWHNDSKPSLFIYSDKYRCVACGKHGSTQSLVKSLEFIHPQVRFKGKFKSENPWSAWLGKHELSDVLRAASYNAPIQYLRERGIDNKIQKELGIGWIENWITFPIENEYHDAIGAVARKGEGNPSASKYILPRGQDPNLLYIPSMENCNQQDRIYVTFGILDAVTIHAAGLASASTTTGKRINPKAFDNFRKVIVIIPDLGEEGDALKLASHLGWRGKVLCPKFPDQAKDVNDLIWKCHYSLHDVKEMLECNG